MPKNWKDIIDEVMNGEDQSLKFKMRQLMEDPSRMQDTMAGPDLPNQDMMYNPQQYDTMRPPERQDALMNPGFMLDKMRPGMKYDDAATPQQYKRSEDRLNENVYRNSRTPTINPDLQRGMDMMFPPQPVVPGVPSMNNLYDQMPEQHPPRSNMPEHDPHALIENYMKNQDMQQGNSTMQELMNFYTYGGQET